jgi:hypothetical protein
MLWGDVALGPGEATDATSAESVAEAKLRRAAIPADALVGDWHYVGVSDPKPYGTSLRLWRQAGPNPISTVWYDPNNIRGFSLAAASGAKGVLGTTWDGYSSSDVIMNDAFFQVSAAILVADYGWSGRREMPRDLDYSPDDLLRRLYLDGPQPVTTLAGYGLTDARSSSTFSVAGVRFAEIEPLVLRSAILPDRENAATEMVVGSLPSARYLALAVDCAARCSVGEPVARVNVRMADGKELETTLRYGVDVRSPQDSGSVPIGPRAKGLSLVRIALGSGATAIRVTAANRYAGLAVHGISLW